MEEEFCNITWGAKLINLESWIAANEQNASIKIVFPELVIRELQKQYIDNYENERSKVLQYMNKDIFPDIKIQFDVQKELNYNNYISQIIHQAIEVDTFTERGMDLPSDAISLIECAINKRKPFCGETKKSDKGFKDAVLWESILNYKRSNLHYTLILYTSDKGLSEELICEYTALFGDEIFIAHDENQLYEYLGKLCDIDNKDQLNEYKKIRDYLSNCTKEIEKLYKYHIFDGAWFEKENIQEVEIKSLFFDDLYSIKYKDDPKIIYESVFYVKSLISDETGEYYNLNLHLYIDIDINYNLSIMGSSTQYMRFKNN